MKKKKVNLSFKAISSRFPEEDYTADFTLSTLHIDRDEEIVDSASANLQPLRKNKTVLWSHQSYNYPVGKILFLEQGDDTIKGTIKFAVNEYEQAKTLWDLIVGGYVNAGSIGFLYGRRPEILNLGTEDEPYLITVLRNTEWTEFSIVNAGSNREALIDGVDEAAYLDLRTDGADRDINTLLERIERFNDIVL